MIAGNFPYRDDLFVMLQLTAPHFPLLEPIPAGEPVDPKRRKWGDFLMRTDYREIAYPSFFRIEHAHFDLRCNDEVKAALQIPKFSGLRIL